MKFSRTFFLVATGAALAMTTSVLEAGLPQAATVRTGADAAPNPPLMDATRPIGMNAAATPTLSTLVDAAKAADLISTLSGPGPYTVFAPTNAAFSRLPPGTMDILMKPVNRAALAKVLTYHVVPGTITLDDLAQRIRAGGGAARLITVEGEPIVVTAQGGAFLLTDVNGNTSYIETPDLRQSNGIVHVVNAVLVPAKLG